MRRGIWHLLEGNASSAVCNARVRGDTIKTSGTGCRWRALDCACSACLIPSGVSFVSYLQCNHATHSKEYTMPRCTVRSFDQISKAWAAA